MWNCVVDTDVWVGVVECGCVGCVVDTDVWVGVVECGCVWVWWSVDVWDVWWIRMCVVGGWWSVDVCGCVVDVCGGVHTCTTSQPQSLYIWLCVSRHRTK